MIRRALWALLFLGLTAHFVFSGRKTGGGPVPPRASGVVLAPRSVPAEQPCSCFIPANRGFLGASPVP